MPAVNDDLPTQDLGPARGSDRGPEPAPDVTRDLYEAPPGSMPLRSERDLLPGMRVGPYLVQRLIGEGGFGMVYEALETQTIRRPVALKVLKLGMDTRDVVQRFQAERQALALMDHPNIAKVYGAGATDGGRPWFAMEFVPGQPITAFCDEHRLPIAERVKLLMQVCRAVQHAHAKGVIHRDLKPSNILVSRDESGAPFPRVIDFGIAKATRGALGGRTLVTAQGQFFGTPEYMAPEQADTQGLDVDTRADLYALGAILYELLTGTLPIDTQRLRTASIAALPKILREFEPPRPSVRVLSGTPEARALAVLRGLTSEALARHLKTDLDWVTLRALEKDRERRYPSPDALEQELARYLRGEPVLAGPPDTIYKLAKFARRHRVALAAGTAVSLALLTGTTAAVIGFVQARTERDAARAAEKSEREAREVAQTQREAADKARAQAERSAQIATAVNMFLTQMLESANPESGMARDATVRQALDAASKRVDNGALAETPEVELAVRAAIANTYRVLSVLDQAERHSGRAVELAKKTYGLEHEETLGIIAIHALLLDDLGKLRESEVLTRELLEGVKRVFGPAHVNTAVVTNNLASLVRREGRPQEARELFAEAIRVGRQAFSPSDPNVAKFLDNEAILLQEMGDFRAAETNAREALSIYRAAFPGDHFDVAKSLNNLSNILRELGTPDKIAEAQRVMRESLAMMERVVGPDHPETATASGNLANLLRDIAPDPAVDPQGAAILDAEAEALMRRTVEIRVKNQGAEHPDTLHARRNLAEHYWAEGKRAEALAEAESVLRAARARWPEGHPMVASACLTLADLWRKSGRAGEAEPLAAEALALREKVHRAESADVADALIVRARCLLELGRAGEAEPLLRRALAIREQKLGAARWETQIARSILGECLAKLDRHVDALELLASAHAALSADPTAPARRVREAGERLRAVSAGPSPSPSSSPSPSPQP
ncbi:MAG: serine/threonine-protein kinase [Planctomycetota bacterium]|nr:serine/threonine-protein kinase [Planctomycetota bacterium]